MIINSLHDFVNESYTTNEEIIDEMGIKKPERLDQSHIGRARAESVRRASQLAARPQARTFAEVSVDLLRELKRTTSSDIQMETPANTRYYYPRFNETIVGLMNELKAIDANRFRSDFGRWRDMNPTDTDAIYLKTEGPSDFQRSHFPGGGIPSSLRGLGLGYKLYRALLRHAGYISSNPSGTTEKDKAWGSLLSYKSNPDGSPSVDDAHGVIGPSHWMVLEKTLPGATKVEVVEKFIDRQIGWSNTKPDRFDLDDELIEILPETVLVKLDREYLNSLVQNERLSEERVQAILAARSEAQRREEERRTREAEEARERVAREEAETRRRLAARLQRFAADPDADWAVGDFIVVKRYLYDGTYDSLPIRRVVALSGNTYTAVNIRDCIRIDNGEIRPDQGTDSRTTSTKSEWVKVNLDNIPDLNNVNLSATEKKYILQLLNPEARRQREEELEVANTARLNKDRLTNTARTQNAEVLGTFPTIASELKQLVLQRPSTGHIELLKKLRTGNFVKFIVLGPEQRDMLRNQFGIPVFAAFRQRGRSITLVNDPLDLLSDNTDSIVLVNMLTGHRVTPPFVGLGLNAYMLGEVTEADKLRARAGDQYYIAGHMNNWGILAKCAYTTRNTINQPFIYLTVFGGTERPSPIRLDLLRQLVGAPIPL